MPVKLRHTNKRTGEVKETDYYTVVERVRMLHKDHSEGDVAIEMLTEIVSNDAEQVTVKALIQTKTGRYTGHGQSSKAALGIEGQSPLKVAETSAVGRALAFAGYGAVESIASAEEIIAVQAPPAQKPGLFLRATVNPADHYCTSCGALMKYREGTSKKGNAYKGYFCPDRECGGEPVWIPDQPENLPADGTDVLFEAGPPAKADWGGFWARARELEIDQAAAHLLFGVPVTKGLLLEYAQSRANEEKSSLQDTINDMREELEVRIQDVR